MYRHRIKEPLKKALDQGKRFYFLYGTGIKDCYLEDVYYGVYSLKESLRRFFLEREDCGYFVTVGNDGVIVEKESDGKYEDVSSEYLTQGIKKDDEMGEDNEEEESEESEEPQSDSGKKLKQAFQESGVNINNSIGIVKKKARDARDSNEKIAVYFEDFEWLAKLYSSNNNDSLEYIKALKDFYKIGNCYTVVSLEEIELLKKYNFETKGNNVIFLGNPSADEIKYTYLLRFLGKTDFSTEDIQMDIFNELNNISQAIASSKKSLRDAIQVLDAIVINKSGKKISSADFEIAIEKITEEKVTLNDVVIEEEERQKIINAVDSFMSNDDVRDYRKGFILTGPPGTGKTQIVKALANEKNCYFMAPTLSDLKGEFVGQTSGKVKKIFDEARANSPTIMFIDEADTVFPDRNLGGGASDSFNLDMVNQFLQEIEGMTSGKEKIFVIAATNRPNIIDAAIQSRLTERIPISLPSAENRIRIFNKKLERYNFTLNGKRYLNEIQSKTMHMSGRDIENFVKKLNEFVRGTRFKKVENLGDDEESRQALLKVLESNERTLIEDLRRNVPVEIREPEEINMGLNDIIGYESIKERILRQGRYISYSEEKKRTARNFGIRISKGILLYGPPGNAKTMLAQAVAKENNFYFIKVLSKDFIANSISRQLDNLQIIFDQVLRLSRMCSKYNGVVLFFDEFDALASRAILSPVIRGTLLDYLASGEREEETGETKIGIRSPQSRILLIAATNYRDSLDDAVIRKGRIDEHLFMDNPTESEGKEMLKEKFQRDDKIELEEDVELQEVYSKLTTFVRRQTSDKKGVDKESIRPSGSSIINLFDELKAEAYFMNENNLEAGEKIVLSNHIIDGYFSNLSI